MIRYSYDFEFLVTRSATIEPAYFLSKNVTEQRISDDKIEFKRDFTKTKCVTNLMRLNCRSAAII